MLLTVEEIRALNRVIDYHTFVIDENLSKIQKLSSEIKESKTLLRLAKNLREGV